jgi:hypothetical protein
VTEPAPGPRPATTDPNFLLWREVDRLDRRSEALDRRIDLLDQNGSRGVTALKQAVEQLSSDLRTHEQQHADERRELVRNRQWLIGIVVTIMLFLVGPLYPILLLSR